MDVRFKCPISKEMSNVQQEMSNVQIGVALGVVVIKRWFSAEFLAQRILGHWKFLVGHWTFTDPKTSAIHVLPPARPWV